MAEVLIVLGIVGIVASMTLPTLIQNYQKKVWVNSLKKDFTMIQNACRMMLANDGVEDLQYTEFAKALRNRNFTEFSAIGKKYFNNATFENKLLKNKAKLFHFDGSSFNRHSGVGAYILNLPSTNMQIEGNLDPRLGFYLVFLVDVNGTDKKPNKIGSDIFGFYLGNQCEYISLTKVFYWDPSHIALTLEGCTTDKRNVPELSCFEQVIKNGWEIKYDFVSESSSGHHSH